MLTAAEKVRGFASALAHVSSIGAKRQINVNEMRASIGAAIVP